MKKIGKSQAVKMKDSSRVPRVSNTRGVQILLAKLSALVLTFVNFRLRVVTKGACTSLLAMEIDALRTPRDKKPSATQRLEPGCVIRRGTEIAATTPSPTKILSALPEIPRRMPRPQAPNTATEA